MTKIAIFYHCLFYMGDPPVLLPNALSVVREQMNTLKNSGLEDAADQIVCCVNGSKESEEIAKRELPKKAKIVMNGIQSRCENRTILELEKWLPGHEDYLVLYFHTKGSIHAEEYNRRWRRCMMKHLVSNWYQCVKDLEAVYESVGCHWMEPPQTPDGQCIWAGTFWWAKASFLKTLPSIMERDSIRINGLDALEGRYESEVYLCNGPKLPIIRDYHGPKWNPGLWVTCDM